MTKSRKNRTRREVGLRHGGCWRPANVETNGWPGYCSASDRFISGCPKMHATPPSLPTN
jgi:hypothetical protein